MTSMRPLCSPSPLQEGGWATVSSRRFTLPPWGAVVFLLPEGNWPGFLGTGQLCGSDAVVHGHGPMETGELCGFDAVVHEHGPLRAEAETPELS